MDLGGQFDITHKLDKELIKMGFKTANPVAVELTKICVETGKTPSEVLKIYREVLKGLVE